MPTLHEPVLLREVLFHLNPQPNQNYIDCTFGGGGHALAIAQLIKPDGLVIGIDWDAAAIQSSSQGNLILINDNYRNLKSIIGKIQDERGIFQINGVLLDLGLSSDQLGSGSRGFSFKDQGLLDLRFNAASGGPTAAEILKSYRKDDIIRVLKEYGEESLAVPIAKKIIAYRESGRAIETAEMLVQLVSEVYQSRYQSESRKNPATRVFQALRIAVNDEFGNISAALPQAIDILAPGGRLAVISFHSGEDRIVKQFFKLQEQMERIRIITKKPIEPQEMEIHRNPRSRSAKLRVAERI